MKLFLKIIVFLIIIICLAAGTGYFYIKTQLEPPGGNKKVEVVIPKGFSGAETAKLLKDKGLIKNELAFRWVLKNSPGKSVQSGKFVFNTSQSLNEIVAAIDKPVIEVVFTTIPEGLTIIQTAQLLDKKGVCRQEDFLKVLKEKDYIVNGELIKDKEGYLFPETYNFLPEYDAEDVVSVMIKQFDKCFTPVYNTQKMNVPVKLSFKQAVVLASMIEREAQVASERPIIAGVYYNRLKKKMLLECDATVMYALGVQKDVLLYRDLEIDSPYNTYKYPGLPPGAIANPGMDALKAAMNPVKHNYYYYVRNDKKNDGSHVFTSTFAEHQEAISKYQK